MPTGTDLQVGPLQVPREVLPRGPPRLAILQLTLEPFAVPRVVHLTPSSPVMGVGGETFHIRSSDALTGTADSFSFSGSFAVLKQELGGQGQELAGEFAVREERTPAGNIVRVDLIEATAVLGGGVVTATLEEGHLTFRPGRMTTATAGSISRPHLPWLGRAFRATSSSSRSPPKAARR